MKHNNKNYNMHKDDCENKSHNHKSEDCNKQHSENKNMSDHETNKHNCEEHNGSPGIDEDPEPPESEEAPSEKERNKILQYISKVISGIKFCNIKILKTLGLISTHHDYHDMGENHDMGHNHNMDKHHDMKHNHDMNEHHNMDEHHDTEHTKDSNCCHKYNKDQHSHKEQNTKKGSSEMAMSGHDHSAMKAFDTKKWILIVGGIVIFFAFFNLFDQMTNFDKITNEADLVFPFLGNVWVQLTLGTLMFILMEIAFMKGSIIALSKKKLSEDLLVTISTLAAYIYSVIALIVNQVNDASIADALPLFFYEGIEILVLIYLGRFIEEWLENKVSKEMNALESLKPKNARVLRDGKEVEISTNELVIDDIVVIKPGEVIPIDGLVISGETSIDESSLTGESMPINKTIGLSVFGGTISSDGLIHVEVKKLIGDSFISKIIDGVHNASNTKPASQRIADKIAAILIPAVLVIALITFITYLSLGLVNGEGATKAITITITVLVIACPCSFAMTTPMSVMMSSTVSKREGVIFNSKNIFEMIKKIDIIAFDKTGTLTEGKFNVISTTIPKDILSLVVSAEKKSNHPLANSIVKNIKDINNVEVTVKEIVGRGLEVKNGNDALYIGSLKYLKEKISSFKETDTIVGKRNYGSAFIYAFSNNEVFGYIELKDQIKETTLFALSQLRAMGIDVVMITGDQKNTAEHIGSELGIDKSLIYSEVLPGNKSDIVRELQEQGRIVGFVGDGINDSIALVQADLGFAMGEGSDAAIESADIILNKKDMTLISYSIWLSRKTLFNIHRGFTIAIAYNIVAIPLAVSGSLVPAIGAISMILNDSVAMINAITLSSKSKNNFDRKNKKRIKKFNKQKEKLKNSK